MNEKYIIYSGKYIPLGEEAGELLLKIRLNKKDTDNPMIDFLLYGEHSATTPKSKRASERRLFKTF